MNKWDRRFCKLAEFVSKWSKDPNAKVGAVLCSKAGGDVTIGFNGFPMGVEDTIERLQNKKLKRELVVHAEQNAIIAAGMRATGATLYVWGKPICSACAGSIIQAGIKRIVAPNWENEKRGIWRQRGKYAFQMFTEAKIEVDFYFVKNGRPILSSKPKKH